MQEAKKYRRTDIKFTADNEEPDCMRCDHCCDDHVCCNYCGHEYGWAYYIRTLWEEVTDK